MNNSRFKRLNPVELAVIQPDLLRVPSILRHELFSNDIELVVRKEDATSNRRLGSLNFNLSLSLSLSSSPKWKNPGKPPGKPPFLSLEFYIFHLSFQAKQQIFKLRKKPKTLPYARNFQDL